MNRWIVILKDYPQEELRGVRRDKFPQHFKFLEDHFHQIVFSCGLREDAGDEAAFFGGFWVVEADTKDDVVALFNQDPYFQLGLRERIDVFKAHEGYV